MDKATAITFTADGSTWRCSLADYACKKTGDAPQDGGRGGGRAGRSRRRRTRISRRAGERRIRRDGARIPAAGPGRPCRRQPLPGRSARRPPRSPTFAGRASGRPRSRTTTSSSARRARPKAEPLSFDGSEGNYYTLLSLGWSPDSKHLVAFRVRPGYRREVHYVESSPAEQMQPKHYTRDYAKPGEHVDIASPCSSDRGHASRSRSRTRSSQSVRPLRPVWWEDSRGFTFEYNQRGHQVYRMIEVDADAASRAR